jgi:hypothetical protein
VILASSYPLLDVAWTLLALFAFVIWIYLLFFVWSDIFRRLDIAGAAKVVWLLATVILPFVGLFAYLITQNEGMVERSTWRPRLP